MTRKHFEVIRHLLTTQSTGTTSSSSRSVSTGFSTASGSITTRCIASTSGQPLRIGHPRLLRVSRRRDRRRSAHSSTTTTSCWSSRITGRSGSTAASASTNGSCREGLLTLHERPDRPTPLQAVRTWTGAGRASGARAGTTRACSSTSKGASRPGSFRQPSTRRSSTRCSALRGTRRRPGSADGHTVFRPQTIYRQVSQRRTRPDRALRRAVLAIDRRRRLPGAARAGERHRPGRL